MYGEMSPYIRNWLEDLERDLQEGRHKREVDAQDKRHHDEMMSLVKKHKELINIAKQNRNEYDRLDAQYDELVDIIKEHLPEMSISKEEVNARVRAARNSAKLTHPE
jgi:septal ring factor EnvC (AmiA/AmiB activator)